MPLHAKGDPVRLVIPPFIQRTHDMGVPKIDLRQINKLLGDLDVEEFLKLQTRLEAERLHGKS